MLGVRRVMEVLNAAGRVRLPLARRAGVARRTS